MCIMHIKYHFGAVLVLHTRTASLVDAMEVRTQCGGAPTEIWYWSRGVCWRLEGQLKKVGAKFGSQGGCNYSVVGGWAGVVEYRGGG
jgi:hypothetical protein